jgi:hypothetical protein
MRKWFLGIGIAVLAAGLGVAAAFGAKALANAYAPQISEEIPAVSGDSQVIQNPRLFQKEGGFDGMRGGTGMMPGYSRHARDFNADQTVPQINRAASEAITMDEAVQQAEDYAARIGSNVQVAEAMEFERNYYAVLVEKDTGRGVAEILIDRYGRGIGLEPGPGMMWNLKYGPAMHRKASEATDNTLSLEDARQAAQDFLSARLSGATLNEGGYSFYGYYSFDYSADGNTAGMLSVNGLTGAVWPHTWHGAFLSEREMAK